MADRLVVADLAVPLPTDASVRGRHAAVEAAEPRLAERPVVPFGEGDPPIGVIQVEVRARNAQVSVGTLSGKQVDGINISFAVVSGVDKCARSGVAHVDGRCLDGGRLRNVHLENGTPAPAAEFAVDRGGPRLAEIRRTGKSVGGVELPLPGAIGAMVFRLVDHDEMPGRPGRILHHRAGRRIVLVELCIVGRIAGHEIGGRRHHRGRVACRVGEVLQVRRLEDDRSGGSAQYAARRKYEIRVGARRRRQKCRVLVRQRDEIARIDKRLVEPDGK